VYGKVLGDGGAYIEGVKVGDVSSADNAIDDSDGGVDSDDVASD
jgi:hypothetical protein